MSSFWLELVIFSSSSIIPILLIYFQASTILMQQIITLLIIVFFILINKAQHPFIAKYLKWFLLFGTNLLVQLIVTSSGGLFSPFLILLHLTALGLSFLINQRSALIFLVFSMLVVILNMSLNAKLYQLLREDIGSALLYLISFITVIPVSRLLAHNYHIKDTLSKMLTQQVKTEQSIIEGVSELIFVTDLDLKIKSVNGAVENTLHLSRSELFDQPLLQVIKLKDQNNDTQDRQSLPIQNIILENSTRTIQNLMLYLPGLISPTKVLVRIKPILNLDGHIDHLTFVITSNHKVDENIVHQDLSPAQVKHEVLLAQIEKGLSNSPALLTKTYLLENIEEDLILATELEDHALKVTPSLIDTIQLYQKSVLTKQQLAKSLQVNLTFRLDQIDPTEKALLDLKNSGVPENSLPISNYVSNLDPKWMKILFEKLLDISILLASNQNGAKVEIIPLKQDNTTTQVVIRIPFRKLFPEETKNLFMQYYGKLGSITNLQLGSGLEGYIAKNIAIQLNIPINISFDAQTSQLIIALTTSTGIKIN